MTMRRRRRMIRAMMTMRMMMVAHPNRAVTSLPVSRIVSHALAAIHFNRFRLTKRV